VRGLARAAVERGVEIHEGAPALAMDGSTVRTPRAVVHAGSIVLCTNAYTAHLATTRVRPVRGQMLATAPTHPVFERPAYAHRGYQYWRQTADGRVVVGGWRDTAVEREVGEDETPTAEVQTHLDAFLRAHAIDAPVTHRWAGTMGFSHDALPYVGQIGPRVFVCGGFTGHGMAFGPASAEMVASLVSTGDHPDADLFDPSR
jgi:glycine/D-amino acid oxidase-like deaminating enzyme